MDINDEEVVGTSSKRAQWAEESHIEDEKIALLALEEKEEI